MMERQLRETGLSDRSVSTGEKAIAQAREQPPSLLVLDVSLPHGDGFDVVSALRREPALADLIVLRGRERLNLGPTRFLTKSRSTDEEFCALVLEMVGGAAGTATSPT